jgi:Fe-S cluster assembly protein SufD
MGVMNGNSPNLMLLVQPGTSRDFDNDEGPLWDDTDRLPEDCLWMAFFDAANRTTSAEGLVIGSPNRRSEQGHPLGERPRCVGDSQTDAVQRPLAALNTAFTDGWCADPRDGATARLLPRLVMRARHPAALLHKKIEDGAEMTLLETIPRARLNTVMEVDVADKAAFHHVRVGNATMKRRRSDRYVLRLGHEVPNHSL